MPTEHLLGANRTDDGWEALIAEKKPFQDVEFYVIEIPESEIQREIFGENPEGADDD